MIIIIAELLILHLKLADGPGIARGKKIKKKKIEKIIDFFKPITHPATQDCPQKISIGPAVWPAIGNIYIYIYKCLVLLYGYICYI